MIRMHRYEDSLTGLAAFCDVCGEQITESGYVVWDSSEPRNWLVIHQAKCDPDRPTYDSAMPLEMEIVYLANSTGADLDRARNDITEWGSL